jgi:hypothetical protein
MLVQTAKLGPEVRCIKAGRAHLQVCRSPSRSWVSGLPQCIVSPCHSFRRQHYWQSSSTQLVGSKHTARPSVCRPAHQCQRPARHGRGVRHCCHQRRRREGLQEEAQPAETVMRMSASTSVTSHWPAGEATRTLVAAAAARAAVLLAVRR